MSGLGDDSFTAGTCWAPAHYPRPQHPAALTHTATAFSASEARPRALSATSNKSCKRENACVCVPRLRQRAGLRAEQEPGAGAEFVAA